MSEVDAERQIRLRADGMTEDFAARLLRNGYCVHGMRQPHDSHYHGVPYDCPGALHPKGNE